MSAFLVALLLFAYLPLQMLINGWAVHLLWNWFIPSIFGLPLLTIGQSIGLSLVVSLFTVKTENQAKGDKSTLDLVLTSALQPLLFVVIGYIVQLLIS